MRAHALMSPLTEDASLSVVDRLVMGAMQFGESPLNADTSYNVDTAVGTLLVSQSLRANMERFHVLPHCGS